MNYKNCINPFDENRRTKTNSTKYKYYYEICEVENLVMGIYANKIWTDTVYNPSQFELKYRGFYLLR